MKKVLFLLCFVTVNIMCSKSEQTPTKKANVTAVNDVVEGCSICYQDSSGVFTPTIISSGLSGVAALKAHFIKVGNEVFVTGRFSWQGATSTTVSATTTISLPIPTSVDLTNTFGTFIQSQTGSIQQGIPNARIPGGFVGSASNVMQLDFTSITLTTHGVIYYQYSYTIQPIL